MAATDHASVDLGVDPFTLAPDRLRSLPTLADEAGNCERCSLSEGRTKVVFGDGDPNADLMLIGDVPGRHEDLQGRPFVGAVGNLLGAALADVGIVRASTYITTVVKCHGSVGDEPQREAFEACSPYLLEQLASVRPRVVVTLGEFATQLVLRKRVPLARVAGFRFDMHGATLVPTYHPIEALRGNQRVLVDLRRHLRTARLVLEGRLSSGPEALAEFQARQGQAS